ncbi:hypothetical protein NOR_03538 [Metarhizium rileyi]|nr:hypothetical protein NOR_03538 [Metarhizium rileyi RCEF 4871]
MPADPTELQNVSMYGFGAIPNLEASVTSEEPLKRRLRSRGEKMEASDTDIVIVNVRQRSGRHQRPSSSNKLKSRPQESPYRNNKSFRAKPGSKHQPIEILDSEKKAASSDT